MSKWRFEAMSIEDAKRILASNDKSSDTYGDRISARHLLERRFADDGWSPPPIRSYFVRCEHCNATGYQHGRRCGMCRGKGYFETERVT